MNQTKLVNATNLVPNYQRPSEVCQHFKIAKATLWHWAKNRPNFPRPKKIGARVTVFDLDEIEAYLVRQG